MKYLKIALLVGILCLTGRFFFGDRVFSETDQGSVQWRMEPKLEQVRPLAHEPVHVTLKALDQTGKPLENAQIHLSLLTPLPNPWFSTDFPWVEGTTLLDMNQITKTGEVKFQQTFPIRGNYQLNVQVDPLVVDTFKPFQQTIVWAIAEKEIKYRNYFLLLALLIFIGFVGGWLIGAGETLEAGEVAPQKVRLLLSSVTVIAIAVLLFINITAEAGSSHNAEDHFRPVKQNSALENGAFTAQFRGGGDATVGQLSDFTVIIKNADNQEAIANQAVRIQARQLEHNQVIFATQTQTNTQGKFQWQEQFFDGSPHQLTVTLLSDQQITEKPLQLEKYIEVEALHPPLSRRLISLAYMLIVLSVGFLSGFSLHRFRRLT